MSNADAARAEQASHAARARWQAEGNPVVTRSAQVVIDRAAELPADIKAQVHAATGPEGGDPGAGGDG